MVCCTPSLRPNDRVDQCVAPCGGVRRVHARMRACSCGRQHGRLRAHDAARVSPARPSASKRCFQSAIGPRAAARLRGDARVRVARGQQQDHARPTRRIGATRGATAPGFRVPCVAPSSTPVQSMACAIVRFTSRQYKPLVAEGRQNKEIAITLGVSVKTVEFHRARLMTKLNVSSVAELTRIAIQEGLIDSAAT